MNMKTYRCVQNTLFHRLLLSSCVLALGCPSIALAQDETPGAPGIAEGSDIIVTATRANEIAPVTASLQATQPQSVISRSFIEDSLPPTADFNTIAMIAPSVSGFGNANGIGLSESKMQIRGFQDGQFNVTYDGVPFGDTNDPTHHSNTFFPSNTIETLVVDRGPGNASQLGQATFGGNVNMFSRTTRDDASFEGLGSYGSFNTWLLRGVAQTGAIDALGGTEAVFSAQHTETDGARSLSPFHSTNVFGKVMIPISPDVRLTILGTYNENAFNQPDKDGVTMAQVAKLGKDFQLNNDPHSQNFYQYNRTHKTTDFEIVKFDANIAPKSTFENTMYTYSYDNETLSGNDVSLYVTDPAAAAAANVVVLTPGGSKTFGVPGYTKTNKYRVYGDIAKARVDFGFGALIAGGWIEWSDTYRQQRDVDLFTMAPNYKEKAVTAPPTGLNPGAKTPQDIKFDQNSNINHTELFVELELRPIPGLTITPGFKHSDFNRIINAAYNQTTRYAQSESKTYTADLPFLTANYAINPQTSVYFQYAKGFLMPALSALYVDNLGQSTLEPQHSTNYQAGVVYHGHNLSVDADIYKIDVTNMMNSTSITGVGTVFFNEGVVRYKGIEGQITYAFDNGLALFANGSRNYAKTDNPGQARTQISNAPEWTAAGGVLYKNGPIKASLIDKLIGTQWFADGENPYFKSTGYNTTNVSLSYDIGRFTIGLDVTNLFDSRKIVNASPVGTTPSPFDLYFFQPGRAALGTIRFRL
jgi:iron complex outermembrane receptor protein